jgi:hypothetical protein
MLFGGANIRRNERNGFPILSAYAALAVLRKNPVTAYILRQTTLEGE